MAITVREEYESHFFVILCMILPWSARSCMIPINRKVFVCLETQNFTFNCKSKKTEKIITKQMELHKFTQCGVPLNWSIHLESFTVYILTIKNSDQLLTVLWHETAKVFPESFWQSYQTN